jgi:lysophospholipid acyltransferase (LPLAT)-like uncharacterized protein
MQRFLLIRIFYGLTRLFKMSYRFSYAGLENLEAATKHQSHGGYCLASWHEHALAGVLGQAGINYCFIVSRSKDGEFVDFICRRLGFKTVRGSSSRGGKAARQALREMVVSGTPVAFTVDGPRGPRKKCKPGILKTASETGSAILPVAAVADRQWVVRKSWDRSKIPKPFAKIVYQFGPLIEIEESYDEAGFEDMLKKIDATLDMTEKTALEALGDWAKLTRKLPKAKTG